jgi:hypothetical protein
MLRTSAIRRSAKSGGTEGLEIRSVPTRRASLCAEAARQGRRPLSGTLTSTLVPVPGADSTRVSPPSISALSLIDLKPTPHDGLTLPTTSGSKPSPSSSGRLGELPLGIASLDLLGRAEHGEVPADDLLGGLALHALCAPGPLGDAAVGVEHEDGVVAHVLHERAVPLLVLAQRARP